MTTPPPHLMVRVSGNDQKETFTAVGAKAAQQMLQAATDYAGRDISDVLDWGCGPGRVASHINRDHSLINLSGCDPDAEAIEWCQTNLAGDFQVSPLYPPLSYADESFDAVLALSVMTHLQRRTQRQWLKELRRILRPGGVLVATVHGRTAAEAFDVSDIGGIDDGYPDPYMADVLPDGYYRTVLQTEAYTRDAWSDWFDVVAYEEAAIESHDLVVCKRK